mgnify:CR=1 FL=1
MISFDSLTLKYWLEQQKAFLTNARVQKIQQPTRRDFVFFIRNEGVTRKLYININPQYYHVCFMNKETENNRLISIPEKPPMFCMLLRKYLENARITHVEQPEFERILEFYFETYNEISEKIYLCLAVELMGKYSNVILYNYDTNIIIGCAHNVGAEKSREREMSGGLPYVYPSGRPNTWYVNKNSLSEKCEDINSVIDNYYSEYIYNDKINRLRSNCRQFVSNQLKKDRNSLKKMQSRLDKEKSFDKYRLYGDLIMANLYNLKDYQKSVNVYDYENGKEIALELDETKTLKENANNFYKLYNKSKTSILKLSKLSQDLQTQIDYYEQILYSIEIAESFEDFTEIQSELEPERKSKTSSKMSVEPLEFDLDGCKVFVGRNNRQNDYIVSKLSRDDDLWFHTKDCAGSHVLLRCQEPTDKLIFECAKLAKEYSKGKDSSKVGVIYTRRKFLKKPPKANLGYVTYKCEQEIIV